MNGEKDLAKLLNTMSPELRHGEYVFCTFKGASYGDYSVCQPIASFSEDEGMTLVVAKEVADDKGFAYDGTFRCITLRVHSSLEAVGLTAAVSAKLTEHHISANVIAGYFHDHIFVPSERAVVALRVLRELSHRS